MPYLTGDGSSLTGFEVVCFFYFVGFVIQWLFRMVMTAGTDGQFR